MPDHLFILLGAGASYDCASNYVTVQAKSRPPLTTELFESRFEDVLHFYPLAETAAAEIQPAVESGPIAIEQFLREKLRDSTHLHRRQMFMAVPLYLQHLLFDISSWDLATNTGYTRHPDNYSRLVSAALDLDEAVFITLNYDILLDRRLFAHGPATHRHRLVRRIRQELVARQAARLRELGAARPKRVDGGPHGSLLGRDVRGHRRRAQGRSPDRAETSPIHRDRPARGRLKLADGRLPVLPGALRAFGAGGRACLP